VIGPRIGVEIGIAAGLEMGSSGGAPAAAQTIWTLQKTGGVSGDWDATAYTDALFTGTTVLSFTIAPIDGASDAYAIGLSADNPDPSWNTIDFAVLNDAGTMYANENGALTALGATVPGDDWTVTRTMGGGAVTIHKNGVLAHTFAGSSVAALRVDSSFRFSNDPVNAVAVTDGGVGIALAWTTSGVTATQE
jgi:hypothetical protein